MRLIDAEALLSRLKQPTVEDINEVLRLEYDNAPNDAIAAEAIHNMYETVREVIKDAPTIESPRPDWTPCAEGLPENQGQYQCTIKDSRLATWLKVEPINMLGVRYFYDGRWYNRDDVDPDVIAWQPLPSPYNPDRKEDADHIVDANKKFDQEVTANDK